MHNCEIVSDCCDVEVLMRKCHYIERYVLDAQNIPQLHVMDNQYKLKSL